ncbi:MAG: hypothetical protein JNG82_12775 [Opitutaceae bacterium]|nr:hypothetical protein [Opitutaceae bacterium]
MTERIKYVAIIAVLAIAVVASAWWDGHAELNWEMRQRASFCNGSNPHEVVSRWNEISWNPFTWRSPFSRKLVFARASEIQDFSDEGLIAVSVTRVIDTKALRVPEDDEIARAIYWFDRKKQLVARVETDMFWVRRSEKTYEPIQKGSDSEAILLWAEAKIGRK